MEGMRRIEKQMERTKKSARKYGDKEKIDKRDLFVVKRL